MANEDNPQTKGELLTRIAESRRRLEASIASLPDEKLPSPDLDAGWSVKDVMAHIAEWESYVVRRVEARRRGETPEVWSTDDDNGVDAVNRELYERNRGRSLEDVQQEFDASHQRIVAVIESLSEGDLFDDSRREAVIGPWPSPVWMHVAGNTFWHYDEHAETIESLR